MHIYQLGFIGKIKLLENDRGEICTFVRELVHNLPRDVKEFIYTAEHGDMVMGAESGVIRVNGEKFNYVLGTNYMTRQLSIKISDEKGDNELRINSSHPDYFLEDNKNVLEIKVKTHEQVGKIGKTKVVERKVAVAPNWEDLSSCKITKTETTTVLDRNQKMVQQVEDETVVAF